MVQVVWQENYEVVIWTQDRRNERKVNKGDVFEMNEDEARDRVAAGQVSYAEGEPVPPVNPSATESTAPVPPDATTETASTGEDAPKNEE